MVALTHGTEPPGVTVPSPPKCRVMEPLGMIPHDACHLVSRDDQAWSPDSPKDGNTSACSQGEVVAAGTAVSAAQP